MATDLFLRNTSLIRDQSSPYGLCPAAITTAGSSTTTTATVTSASTARQWTWNSKTYWVSPPLSANFTVAGAINVTLRAREASTGNNQGGRCVIFRLQSNGTATQIGTGDDGVEFTTSNASYTWTITPTSTNFVTGDRIGIQMWATPTGGTGGVGTQTMYYDGANGGSYGTKVNFTETFTFSAEPQSPVILVANKALTLAKQIPALVYPPPTKLYLRNQTTAPPHLSMLVGNPAVATAAGTGTETLVGNISYPYYVPFRWNYEKFWVTPPFPECSFTGAIEAHLRAAANTTGLFARINVNVIQVFADGTWSGIDTGYGQVDLTTTNSEYTVTLPSYTYNMAEGDRLAITIYAVASDTPGGPGYITLYYDGADGGNYGSYIKLVDYQPGLAEHDFPVAIAVPPGALRGPTTKTEPGNFGLWFGGYNESGDVSNDIDGYNFTTDVNSHLGIYSPVNNRYQCQSAGVYGGRGYFCDVPYNVDNTSRIDKIRWFQKYTGVVADCSAQLSSDTWGTTLVASDTVGYFVGGTTYAGGNSTAVQRYLFATDSMGSAGTALSVARTGLMGVSVATKGLVTSGYELTTINYTTDTNSSAAHTNNLWLRSHGCVGTNLTNVYMIGGLAGNGWGTYFSANNAVAYNIGGLGWTYGDHGGIYNFDFMVTGDYYRQKFVYATSTWGYNGIDNVDTAHGNASVSWPGTIVGFGGLAPTVLNLRAYYLTPYVYGGVFQGQEPNVSVFGEAGPLFDVASRALSLAGYVPGSGQSYVFVPGVGGASVVGGTGPEVRVGLPVSSGVISISSFSPVLLGYVPISVDRDTVLLTGYVPGVDITRSLYPPTGALSLVGQANNPIVPVYVGVQNRSLAFSGNSFAFAWYPPSQFFREAKFVIDYGDPWYGYAGAISSPGTDTWHDTSAVVGASAVRLSAPGGKEYWITPPIGQAVTVTEDIEFWLRAFEYTADSHHCLTVKVFKLTPDGTATQFGTGSTGELSDTPDQVGATIVPTATSFAVGDRIGVEVWGDVLANPVSDGVYFYYDGAYGTDRCSFFQFGDTVVFSSEALTQTRKVSTGRLYTTNQKEGDFGLWAGGGLPNTLVTLAARGWYFATETITEVGYLANLPSARENVSWGSSSGNYGYLAGGDSYDPLLRITTSYDDIFRYDRRNGTGTNLTQKLPVGAYKITSVHSSEDMFLCGGTGSGQTRNKFQFATETITATSYDLTASRVGLLGISTPSEGYITYGGDWTNLVHFATDTIEAITLTGVTHEHERGGAGTQGTHGYLAGGPGTYASKFSFDTRVSSVASNYYVRYDAGGVYNREQLLLPVGTSLVGQFFTAAAKLLYATETFSTPSATVPSSADPGSVSWPGEFPLLPPFLDRMYFTGLWFVGQEPSLRIVEWVRPQVAIGGVVIERHTPSIVRGPYITVANRSLVASGQAPVLSNAVQYPGAATSAFLGHLPGISVGYVVSVAQGLLVATKLIPSVVVEYGKVSVAVASGSVSVAYPQTDWWAVPYIGFYPSEANNLAFVGQAPTFRVDHPTDQLIFVGTAPTVVQTLSHWVFPSTGAISCIGRIPTADINLRKPGTGSLLFQGLVPQFFASPYFVAVPQASLAVSGLVPASLVPVLVPVSSGALVTSGGVPRCDYAVLLSVLGGALSVARLDFGFFLSNNPAKGGLSFSGIAPTMDKGITVGAGVLTVTVQKSREGFFMGGSTFTTNSNTVTPTVGSRKVRVTRFTFATESIALNTYSLGIPRSQSGSLSSPGKGYGLGGVVEFSTEGVYSEYLMDTIVGIVFGSGSVFQLSAVLSVPMLRPVAVGNRLAGYAMMGRLAAGTGWTGCNKLAYDTETKSDVSQTFTAQFYATSMSGGTKGYVGCGYNGTTTYYPTLDYFTYETETRGVSSATLNSYFGKWGAQTPSSGYVGGGYDHNGASYTSISKMPWETETVSLGWYAVGSPVGTFGAALSTGGANVYPAGGISSNAYIRRIVTEPTASTWLLTVYLDTTYTAQMIGVSNWMDPSDVEVKVDTDKLKPTNYALSFASGVGGAAYFLYGDLSNAERHAQAFEFPTLTMRSYLTCDDTSVGYSACSSSKTTGYMLGGAAFFSGVQNAGWQQTAARKMPFSTEVDVMLGWNLSALVGEGVGGESDTRGYAFGGISWTTHQGTLAIQGVRFDNETFVDPAGTLATHQWRGGSSSHSLATYLYGGHNSSNIHKMVFATETGVSVSASLSVAAEWAGAAAAGGAAYINSSGPTTDTIKLSVETETLTSIVADTSTAALYNNAATNIKEGFFAANPYTGTNPPMRVLNYATETASLLHRYIQKWTWENSRLALLCTQDRRYGGATLAISPAIQEGRVGAASFSGALDPGAGYFGSSSGIKVVRLATESYSSINYSLIQSYTGSFFNGDKGFWVNQWFEIFHFDTEIVNNPFTSLWQGDEAQALMSSLAGYVFGPFTGGSGVIKILIAPETMTLGSISGSLYENYYVPLNGNDVGFLFACDPTKNSGYGSAYRLTFATETLAASTQYLPTFFVTGGFTESPDRGIATGAQSWSDEGTTWAISYGFNTFTAEVLSARLGQNATTSPNRGTMGGPMGLLWTGTSSYRLERFDFVTNTFSVPSTGFGVAPCAAMTAQRIKHGPVVLVLEPGSVSPSVGGLAFAGQPLNAVIGATPNDFAVDCTNYSLVGYPVSVVPDTLSKLFVMECTAVTMAGAFYNWGINLKSIPIPAGAIAFTGYQAGEGTEFSLDLAYRHYGSDILVEIQALVNDMRADISLPPVEIYVLPGTPDVAQKHSIDMWDTGIFAHEDVGFPAGWQTQAERQNRIPYSSIFSENIAGIWYQSITPAALAASVVDAWWNSPPHKANMLADWGSAKPHYMLIGLEVGKINGQAPESDWFLFTQNFFQLRDAEMQTWSLNLYWDKLPAAISENFFSWDKGAYSHVVRQAEFPYSLQVSRGHEAQWGCHVAAQHEAPTFYTLSVGHEAPYTQTQGLTSQHQADYRIREYVDAVGQHEASYGLAVSRGMVSSYTFAVPVVKAHNAPYGFTQPVVLGFESGYQDSVPVVGAFSSPYQSSLAVTKAHTLSYGGATQVVAAHTANYQATGTLSKGHTALWGSAVGVTKWHSLLWDDMALVRKGHEASWGDGSLVAAGHTALWSLNLIVSFGHEARYTEIHPISTQHEGRHSLLVNNPVAASMVAFYSLISSGVDVSDQLTFLRIYATGEHIDIVSLQVECDEGDVFWSARIVLADYADYIRIKKGDLIEVVIWGDVYVFLVDTKAMQRSGVAPELTLTGVGIAAMYTKPIADPITTTFTEAMNASVIVEQVLQSNVDWQMHDWSVPAYRFAVSDITPLEAAKVVVEAAGGLLESTPGGEFVARYKYPVSPRKYDDPLTVVSHILTDGEDNISVEESSVRGEYYDRVRVADSNVTQADRIEFEMDEGFTDRGTLKVSPFPWRTSLVVEHTSGEIIELNDMGIVQETITENVEFTFGSANTSKPILSITSIEWRSVPLGGVSFEPRSSELRTPTIVNGGFGVISLTYVSEHIEYHTKAPAGSVVQYIVEELTGE